LLISTTVVRIGPPLTVAKATVSANMARASLEVRRDSEVATREDHLKDYYALLRITRDASSEEVKRSYRTLALQYHPDKNDTPEAESQFKEITEAYAVLIDPDRRRQYDREGLLANPQELAQEVRNAFWEMVGDIFPAAKKRARRRDGQDLKCRLEITLEEAIFGTTKEIKVPRWRSCEDCEGRGGTLPNPPRACPQCLGKGESKGSGLFATMKECELCRGRGIAFATRCNKCRAKGTLLLDVPLSLTFPTGIQNGQHILVRGAGHPGEGGGKDGELNVELIIKPHPLFTVQGADIVLELPLRLDEALQGTKLPVPTPEGAVTIKIPANTQSGKLLKIAGRGALSPKGGRGDFLVKVQVETPSLSSEAQAQLLNLLQSAQHLKRSEYIESAKTYIPYKHIPDPEEPLPASPRGED
jgi:molecular chaperone DnaJ